MNYGFTEINDSNEIVSAFFNDNRLYIKTFMQLIKYAHAFDKDIAIKYRESIIGASKEDSDFYFYVVDQESDYYIKYRHLPTKIIFSASSCDFSKLKEECRKAIEYLEIEPGGVLPPEGSDNKNEKYSETDKEFQSYYEFFEKYRDTKIKDCPFPQRVKNALAREGLIILGDLVGLCIADLSKIRYLGEGSIRNILRVCYSMFVSEEVPIPTCGDKKGQGQNDYNEWEAVRNVVNNSLEKDDNTIILDLDTDIAERIMGFRKNIELQVTSIIESTKGLSDRNKDIIMRCIATDETYSEISRDYNLTRERVRQIKNKSIEKIQRGIYGHKVKPEIIDSITHVVIDADKRELGWYLSYLMNERIDTWKCIRSIFAENIEKMESALVNYKVVLRPAKRNNSGKRDFHISREEKEKVIIGAISLPITSIVRNINNAIDNTKYKELRYESVLKWMVVHGYIYEEKTQNQIIWRPTEKGFGYRIFIGEKHTPSRGTIYITYYPPSIQRLIVEHANEMK